MDFELIEAVALVLPDYAFVFVGPVLEVEFEVEALQAACKNVYFEPAVEQSQLPAILQAFSVCIIPFVKNDITDAVSPVKLFEYVSADKPVVTTNLLECQGYEEVLIANDALTFTAALEQAMTLKNSLTIQTKLRELAAQNRWQDRIDQIMKQLDIA